VLVRHHVRLRREVRIHWTQSKRMSRHKYNHGQDTFDADAGITKRLVSCEISTIFKNRK